MFSKWFSGNNCAQYQTSPHKQRIDQVGRSLLEKQYVNEAIRHHLHEWLRFTFHLNEQGHLVLPSPSADSVRQYLSQRTLGKSASHSRFIRASLRIFLEADDQGKFRRRVGSIPLVPSWFSPILTSYLHFVNVHRGLAAMTLKKYSRNLSRFAQYLEHSGIRLLEEIEPRQVQAFYENAEGSKPRRSYGSTLRAFFRWAATQGWLPSCLTDAIPRPRRYRLATLPDVLGQAEVDRVLAAVDRSSPVGRRDYAVLLLAARYGLRPCDIRQLTLDHIDWRGNRIDIRQAKTGRPLALPLLPDIAHALSAYLRDGRPVSTNRVIFLRHRAPFEPFAAENNLVTIMRAALQRSGLANRPGRKGLYLFRHTLATRLLATGQPIKAIADVLGHASTETTYGYTRVELDGLRTVAISQEEVIL